MGMKVSEKEKQYWYCQSIHSMPAWFNDVTKIIKKSGFIERIGEVTVSTDEGNIFAGAGE